MNIFLLIVSFIVIILLTTFKNIIKNPFYDINNIKDTIDKSMVVDNCVKTDNDLQALYAPNIPMDPRSTFVIGKKYCSFSKEMNLSTLPPLLYDGIWKNHKSICQNDENTFLETNKFSL